MLYLIRPIPGHLALCKTPMAGAGELDQGKLKTFGIPDEEFWAWLKQTGVYDVMVKENPDRMARVEANGVGVLRSEKQILLDAGFTRAETVSKRPEHRPIQIGYEDPSPDPGEG